MIVAGSLITLPTGLRKRVVALNGVLGVRFRLALPCTGCLVDGESQGCRECGGRKTRRREWFERLEEVL
jgi:hypothetical protein